MGRGLVAGVTAAGAIALACTAQSYGARAGPRAAPHPDLTGIWTNGWYTEMERPKEFKALIATPAEAQAFEAPRRALNGMLSGQAPLGQAEAEFNEGGPGLARIHGEIRSSWITDPPDGQVPWSAAARERYSVGKPPVQHYDNVEERPLEERCLTARGAFAPILNSPDTNYVQIVQTPGHVVIVSEKNHDTRIAPINSDGGAPAALLPVGLGESRAHWEGQTLVVDSTGYRFTRVRGLILTPTARVTERFTRTGPRELGYRFEVEDPALFTKAWRGEMVFRAADAPMYEFACHEGNYALPSILAAARQGNQSGEVPEPVKGGK